MTVKLVLSDKASLETVQESLTTESVRELALQASSRLFQYKPPFINKVESVLRSELEANCPAILEGLILGIKCPTFVGNQPYHVKKVFYWLSYAVVVFSKTRQLSAKQLSLITTCYESLLANCCDSRVTCYSKCRNRLMWVFDRCKPVHEEILAAVSEISSRGKFLLYCVVLSHCKIHEKPVFEATVASKALATQCGQRSLVVYKEAIIDIMQNYDSATFAEKLFPELKRTLIRQAERGLPAVRIVLESHRLDMSEQMVELAEILVDFILLESEHEQTVHTLGQLIKRCSQPESIEKTVNLYISIVSGKHEKKCGSATQKIYMYQALKALANHGVPESNCDAVSGKCISSLIKMLKPTDPVVTQTNVLSILQVWSSRFVREIPPEFIKWMEEPSCNTQSAQVQTCLARLTSVFTQRSRFHDFGTTVVPVRAKRIETVANDTVTLIQLHDLIPDVLFCLKYIEDEKANSAVRRFLKNSSMFASLKVLNLGEHFALSDFCRIVGSVILDHNDLCAKSSELMLALQILSFHHSHEVRKEALSSLKKVCAVFSARELSERLEQAVAIWREISNERMHSIQSLENFGEKLERERMKLSGKLLHKLILTIVESGIMQLACSASNDGWTPNDVNFLFSAVMNYFFEPEIMAYGKTWKQLCGCVGIFTGNVGDIKGLSEEHQARICVNAVLEAPELSPVHKEMLRFGAANYTDGFCPRVLERYLELLQHSEFFAVTRTEFQIYETPEGQVWDKEVMKQVERMDDSNNPIKGKQDKGMKYKDELAFRELAKLAKKPEKKYNNQQQQLIDQTLEKEAKVRRRLADIYSRVEEACDVIRLMTEGAPHFMKSRLHRVMPLLAKLVGNPLCVPLVINLIHQLSQVALRGSALLHRAALLSFIFAKINYPEMEVGRLAGGQSAQFSGFGKLSAKDCIESLLEILKTQVVTYIDDNEVRRPLDVALFAFCHPALHSAIHLTSQNDELSPGEKFDCIEAILLMYDAQMSAPSDPSQGCELPVVRILNSMFFVLQEYPPAIQNKAKLVADKVCQKVVAGSDAMDAELNGHLCSSLTNDNSSVRLIALQCCRILLKNLLPPRNSPPDALKLFTVVYALQFDEEQSISKFARALWGQIDESQFLGVLCDSLMGRLVCHHVVLISTAASAAVENLLDENPTPADSLLDRLMQLYREKQTFVPAVNDSLGRVIKEEIPDIWQPRFGIALCFKSVIPNISPHKVVPLFGFFVDEALDDVNDSVRQKILAAALEGVEIFGKEQSKDLLMLMQAYLDSSDGKMRVKQAVIIMMGSLAKHLMGEEQLIKPIVSKLMESLSVPSPLVQEAVANCLPKLVEAIKAECPALVEKLMALLLSTDDANERRGAAFGVAGLVKGLGIMSLKQLNVMTQLQQAIDDKKSVNRRLGALLGFQTLCILLGRLFEPYLVTILPHLLLAFGDNDKAVREMAEKTSEVVMEKLTVHGVKIVLPILLKGVEEDSWRTKVGCIQLLGAMSHCAPKQLSSCLPVLVPKLLELLNDSHHKVAKCAFDALKQVASVIKNPEILSIAPTVLSALDNSHEGTKKCLQVLLKTRFVHMIDAASLSLIMPIIENAFKDRSSETRKIACQILGNINSLTDSKDLLPYLNKLIPGFKTVLVDPVPEIRGHASRALGAMVRGLGEDILNVILPWLLETVVSPVSNIDRSGAAQGLCEVYASLGPSKLQEVLPVFVKESLNPQNQPHVRDGYMSVFIYLPSAFGSLFAQYIDVIIPAILQGLASETEFLRDSAFRAGQQIINQYSSTSVAIFLPELDKGLFDESWRIRLSSVQLLGDLLFKLLGITGKMSTETEGDDDTFANEKTNLKLSNILKPERRDRVLGGLYMGRNDVSLPVRQAALHVWKIVVANTPRTLREILPTLFSLLLGNLACECEEKQQIAARTLGDLAKKLGDRVLPEIIPILEAGLRSNDIDHRQGVCVGLGEVMASTSRDQVQQYLNIIVPTVEMGLCDAFERVREAAAHAFDKLYNIIQTESLDQVLKPLTKKLTDPVVGEYATDGLKQVIALKSRVVMPYLIPQLTKPPANIAALAIIAPVAGDTLNNHLEKILPALVNSLAESVQSGVKEEDLAGMQIMLDQVTDLKVIAYVIDYLLGVAANFGKNPNKAFAALKLLNCFITNTSVNLADYANDAFKGLISTMLAELPVDSPLMLLSYETLAVLVKKLDSSEQIAQLFNLRQAIRQAANTTQGATVNGFCIPKKGITAVLPIYRESILNGSQESKEQAAIGLSEIIRLTTASALQPSVINITGPLIRILGERYSVNVRIAFLATLTLLLQKVGAMLKAFLPQLQNTFMKALSDQNEKVKVRGAEGVGLIMGIHLRPDPVFTELLNLVQGGEDVHTKAVALSALQMSITAVGPKMNPAIRDQINSTLLALKPEEDENFRRAQGGCLGALSGLVDDAKFEDLVQSKLLDISESRGVEVCHTNAVALCTACRLHPARLLACGSSQKCLSGVKNLASSKNILIAQTGLSCCGYLLVHMIQSEHDPQKDVCEGLKAGIAASSMDIRQYASKTMDFICHASKDKLSSGSVAMCSFLGSELIKMLEDPNSLVKFNAESALCRVFLLHTDAPRTSGFDQMLDAKLGELAPKMKSKFKTRVLETAEDIDISSIR